jgi:pimeloyl-ACP methyl ester carboxylesterase
VLFLHGFPDSWFTYSQVLPLLPGEIRAIVPSQRGFGASEQPDCCYLIPDLARDAVALLDALGLQRVDIVGHSWGSFIAQRVAIDHPARVNRLVLIGSAGTTATAPIIEVNGIVQTIGDSVSRAFAHEFQASTAYQPLAPAFLERLVDESMKIRPHVWRAVVSGMLQSDARHELTQIRPPTLLLWGRHDGLFDEGQQKRLLRELPNVRLITYDDLGHSPFWEDPKRVAADIAQFLAAR